MKKSLFLATIFIISILSPIALADVTETQFQDGSTSYTHTFTGTGDGFAGNLTFPYGAEVSSATFDLAGHPSSTTWGNLTTNSDFGGAGSGTWSGTPPGFAYGNRNNMEVGNDQVKLLGNPTNNVNGLDRAAEATSTGTINNTGGFAANGDQGFIGSTKPLTDFSLTSSTSSYRGFVIAHEDEYHSATYSTTTVYTTPILKRYNSTTGAYIWTSNVSSGSCSYTTPLYSTYDATSDGNGNVWTVSYSYRILVKWSVSSNGDWKWQHIRKEMGGMVPTRRLISKAEIYPLLTNTSSQPLMLDNNFKPLKNKMAKMNITMLCFTFVGLAERLRVVQLIKSASDFQRGDFYT